MSGICPEWPAMGSVPVCWGACAVRASVAGRRTATLMSERADGCFMLALLDLVSRLPMNKAAANPIDFSRFGVAEAASFQNNDVIRPFLCDGVPVVDGFGAAG